jgi:hypothetical protein
LPTPSLPILSLQWNRCFEEFFDVSLGLGKRRGAMYVPTSRWRRFIVDLQNALSKNVDLQIVKIKMTPAIINVP